MHCVNKQILQRKTEFIWSAIKMVEILGAIKIRTICAVNTQPGSKLKAECSSNGDESRPCGRARAGASTATDA